MRALLLLAAATLIAACAAPGAGRYLPGAPEIQAGDLLTAAGMPLAASHLDAAIGPARYVLVGEAHDSACDHAVQAAIVRALAHRRPVVGFEMVSVERQPILDRFASGEIELDALADALDWNARWGIAFALYRPIFAAAREAELPIAALNLPAEIVRRVSREGESALPPEVPALIPPPPEQEPMLRQAFAAHGSDGSDEDFDRFVRVQSLWDTAMANQALSWSRRLDRPLVAIAGAGHVAHGWGIAHRLRRLDPDAAIAIVMPWRGDGPLDPDQADLFFYCPRDSSAG